MPPSPRCCASSRSPPAASRLAARRGSIRWRPCGPNEISGLDLHHEGVRFPPRRQPRSRTVKTPDAASPGRVLIADDQRDVLEALRLLLKGEGFAVETAASPAGALAALEANDFDAVLMDLNYARDTTSGEEGLDLLARVQGLDPMLPVVVMTAWGTVDLAVEAMRRGARDFVQKPWDNARLLAVLRTQIELA